MDPITLASQRFRASLMRHWEPPPGHAPATGAVRMAFSASERKEVMQSLRLLEWDSANRRPFFVMAHELRDPGSFVRVAMTRLSEDYQALAKGLAEEGVSLPELPGSPSTLEGWIASLRWVAAKLVPTLDGLVLVLAPAKVHDDAAYVELVARMATVCNGDTLRLLVADAPGLDARHPALVRFEVDEEALRKFLKEMGTSAAQGPPPRTARMSPSQKAELEATIGKGIPSAATGADLRGYLLDAAAAMQAQNWKLAVKKFRAARMLCHVSGLREQEATTSIALGTTVFAAGDRRGAIAAYKEGKKIAIEQSNLTLAAQAELGMAAVRFAAAELAQARAHYRAVVELAADLPPLRIDALRMEGECFAREQDRASAIRSLDEALTMAGELAPEVRAQTSYELVGATLLALLDAQGPSGAVAARAVRDRLQSLQPAAAATA